MLSKEDKSALRSRLFHPQLAQASRLSCLQLYSLNYYLLTYLLFSLHTIIYHTITSKMLALAGVPTSTTSFLVWCSILCYTISPFSKSSRVIIFLSLTNKYASKYSAISIKILKSSNFGVRAN